MPSHNITSSVTKQEDQICCKRTDQATILAQTQSVTNTFPVWGIDTAAHLLSRLPKSLPNYSDNSRSDRYNDVAQIERIKEALTCLLDGWTEAAPGSGNNNKSNISSGSNFCKASTSVADHPCGPSSFDSKEELPDECVPCRTIYIKNSAQPSAPNTGKWENDGISCVDKNT